VTGSRNDGRIVNANFNQDGNLNVNWNLNADNHNPNLGGRSSAVSCKINERDVLVYLKVSLILLEIVSSRQSYGRFLEGYFLVVGIFCYRLLCYLWQV